MDSMCLFNTGLYRTGAFTVLPTSGSIVVQGQASWTTPNALHHFRTVGTRLEKLRQCSMPCTHFFASDYFMDLLGVTVQQEEMLAMLCQHCKDIKLMNMETGEVFVSYKREQKKPHRMCHGEEGRMWVSCMKDNSVEELNCTSEALIGTGIIVNTIETFNSMAFLPLVSALVLSHHRWVEVVSCDTGHQLWKLDNIAGETISPREVAFLPRLSSLIMADPQHDQLVTLNPGTGEPLQCLSLPEQSFRDFTLLGECLLLRFADSSTRCLHQVQLVDVEAGLHFFMYHKCPIHALCMAPLFYDMSENPPKMRHETQECFTGHLSRKFAAHNMLFSPHEPIPCCLVLKNLYISCCLVRANLLCLTRC